MNNQTEITNPGAVSNNAGNAQTTNQSGSEEQVKPDTSATVKLELSEEEADMILSLLNGYVLAYRSDRSVDYKPEPVPREKVGQYPYVATPPAPEIINPAYDWINKKWYSKNASDSLPDLANTVADLKATQLVNEQQSLMLTQMIQKTTESQNASEKLMTSIQAILVGIKATQDQGKATPIESQTNQK